jgi:uncharacterized membrane protein YkvA (DUF1232 family)
LQDLNSGHYARLFHRQPLVSARALPAFFVARAKQPALEGDGKQNDTRHHLSSEHELKMKEVKGDWAKPGSTLKLKVLTSWFSYRHPNIPALPKLIALLLVAYAFSPIDLIPDFIPVIGYLDDLVILPIGVYFLTKLIPAPIWSESEQKARYWIEEKKGKPKSYAGVVFVVVIWMLLGWLAWWAAGDYFVSRN